MRRRYVWDPETKELVEVSRQRQSSDLHYVQGEMERFISPVDGSVVDGRRAYREHCKRHNVVNYHEKEADFARGEKKRAEIRAGTYGRKDRIAALSDAFEHVRNQNRARFGK